VSDPSNQQPVAYPYHLVPGLSPADEPTVSMPAVSADEPQQLSPQLPGPVPQQMEQQWAPPPPQDAMQQWAQPTPQDATQQWAPPATQATMVPMPYQNDEPVPAPMTPPVAAPPADSELVTCPECGNTAVVTLNRRQSEDFCRNCDFPLFWTPSEVVLGDRGLTDESLRRMPGTTGRARTASIPCPHCAEPNQVSAQVCVRCGRSMRVEAPPPAPEPVYVPPPTVYIPPPKRTPWWVWAIVGVVVAAIAVLAVLYANGTIG
jgi:hypothetical protein